MTDDEFRAFADPALEDLQRRYSLDGWKIRVRVVADDKLHPRNAAEVAMEEEYRSATIYFARTLVEEGDEALLRSVLEHELQHVFLYPLDALRSLVLDMVPKKQRPLILGEFRRANERVRAGLDKLLYS